MQNLLKFAILLGLLLACIFLSYRPGLAESWWESKQAGNPTDQIQISPSMDIPGKVQSASRTNWEDGYIEVMAGATADQRDTINTAHAFAVALKSARHLAYEKLAETVGGLNLYSDATYDRELMIDSNLRTVVRSLIRNARVVDETKSQFPDGSIWVEVALGMKLNGDNGLITPSVDWYSRRPVKTVPLAESSSAKSVSSSVSGQADYSGRIIDATGLDAAPAMLPKILSEDVGIIYGTGEIDKNYVLKMGIMGYQGDLAKAKKLERTGKNPLIIRARAVSGKNKCDFVVSRADAARIRDALKVKDFLKECRVVAVLK